MAAILQENLIKNIISTLQKPLSFASKDNFAHLPMIKDMQSFVMKVCSRILSSQPSQLSRDNLNKIIEFKNLFEGFDGLALKDKKEIILKASQIITRILNDINNLKNNSEKLSTQIEYVKGIGPKVGKWFRKKGVASVLNLLYFLPFRYEDRRNIKRISHLLPGSKEAATGEIMVLGEVFYGRKRLFEIVLSDGSGILKLKWFNYSLNAMKRRYKAGQRVIAFGSIGLFNNQKEIVHPDIEIIDEDGEAPSNNFNSIAPVYSSVGSLHQKTLRKIMRNAVSEYAHLLTQGVPDSIRKRHGLMEIESAIKGCHIPTGLDCMDLKNFPARKSLVFDELFFLELGLANKKRNLVKEGGISFNIDSSLAQKLKGILPFKLTPAQERVISEIKGDMSSPHPMNRLIQGDVGSGKTIVAFTSMLIAIDNGYQAALMAPTEILAEQHYLNINRFANEVNINTCLLTSSVSKPERKELLSQIKDGGINLVAGTHALIQEDVEFRRLGLAVVDEQHKFGVIQRAMLKKKGAGGLSPDMLVMTATPIPRTLTMTVFGDLDVSIIDELPTGRKPVDTMVFREKDRERVYKILREELNKGRQIYIVYPLIEENEELELKDATSMAEHLKKDVFPDFKVRLLHGRLHVREKEDIMKAFKDKSIDILVSTTVIEVGIDVPNATVMLIEHAERFGLSQLHQLRGRVGRGGHKSFCLLLAYKIGSVDSYRRLKIMEETGDGFRIAEEDLKIRGPGDFLGTRQSGLPDFRVSDLLYDAVLLKKARDEAFRLIHDDPDLTNDENCYLKEILKTRWKERFELATVG